MEKLIRKITNIAIVGLTVVAIAISLILMFSGSPLALDISLYLTYFMCLVAIVIILFFVIMQLAANMKQLIRALILGIAIVAVFFVCYLTASTEVSEIGLRVGVSATVYQWIGAMLSFTYIAFLGVILAFIGTLIYVKIKNK